MNRPVHVLGVGLSHNGAACLLRDGRIVVAIEKERLTRIKNDGGNDTAAIRYCLDAAGIGFAEVDLLVQNANFGRFAYGNDWYRGPRDLPPELPVVTISHHLAHAWSAYALSPFDEAAILIVDGCGNAFEDCMDIDGAILPERPSGDMASLWFEKDSFYTAAAATLTPVYKDFSPLARRACDYPMHSRTTRHSIGGVYQGGSEYVFPDTADLGKLMGLAPYGRPGVFDHPIFRFEQGRLFANEEWIAHFTRRVRSVKDFKARFQYFADVALMIQREIERALLELVRARHALRPMDNLCFAGGVALNAVANRRILEEAPFERMFVPPAADDSGLAIGCAYYGWHCVLGHARGRHDSSPFLGRAYPESEIERALAQESSLHWERPVDIVAAMVERIAAGRTVAWFRGGSEFGPRALGHRSILADPRPAAMRDQINTWVKFREDFRPFAPAVLAEDADQYFVRPGDSPYMLFVVPVRPEWREQLGAVTHVDGTARVQTVRAESDPDFHRLLMAWKERAGIGMLLNTSLNRRGQPIVESPAEALALLRESGLDDLAIGPWLVSKAGNNGDSEPRHSPTT